MLTYTNQNLSLKFMTLSRSRLYGRTETKVINALGRCNYSLHPDDGAKTKRSQTKREEERRKEERKREESWEEECGGRGVGKKRGEERRGESSNMNVRVKPSWILLSAAELLPVLSQKEGFFFCLGVKVEKHPVSKSLQNYSKIPQSQIRG